MAPDTTLDTSAVDRLTLATLYLCNISYFPNIKKIAPSVAGVPPLGPGGQWRNLWGPAQADDESNLAFVAGYFPPGAAGPQYICVTVRGTDFDIYDIFGILEQIWQDIDATDPQPMPWAPLDSARIAGGTLEGLTVIQNLAVNGQTLTEYLQTFFSSPANANVTSLVTGHSLGGCLATVVAPWMRSLLTSYTGPIQPIVFAGPTAGNADFATYYDTTFPLARRFQNSLDVIPLAFENLYGVDSIYSDYGLYVPDPVWLFILGMQEALDYMEVTYVQPSNGAQLLPGIFLLNDQYDWYAQALHQHHLATYLSLLTGTPVDTATLPQPSVSHNRKARLVKRIGSIRNVLRRTERV